MLQIIKTNLYRTITNKRLWKVLFVYLLIFLSVAVCETVLPLVNNLNTDQGFAYEYERFKSSDLLVHNFWEFCMTTDMLVMAVIFQFCWLSDYAKDNGFKTMCSISRSRWRIILSNYIVMNLMTPVLMIIKLAALAITAFLFRFEMGSWTLTPEIVIGTLVIIFMIGFYEAFFYLIYTITRSFMVLIYTFFIPFCFLMADRIVWCLPYGEEIRNVVTTIFFAPDLIYELLNRGVIFEGRVWLGIPIYLAMTAPLLFVTCLIAEKRDVR